MTIIPRPVFRTADPDRPPVSGRPAASLAALAVGAVLLLSACSPPAPDPSTTPAATTTAAPSSVTTVAHPVETTSLNTDPCSALTSAEIATVIKNPVTPGVRGTTDDGRPYCRWYPTDDHAPSVAVNTYPTSAGVRPFERLYSYFEPTKFTLAPPPPGRLEFPAARANQLDDQTGGCQLFIQLNAGFVVGVDTVNSNKRDPHYKQMCFYSEALAQDLLHRLVAR